mmetsp:Transcript_3684/g.7686  ORF Transcript_3684/g.7686 Transcript_3684/m.7686 type:complete len:243 (+) Transcript_3684:871-1599(+)
MEERALLLAADRADLLERLDHADLVVDGHDADERGLGPDVVLQLLQVDQPVIAHREVRHLEPLRLERAARVEHALVFGLRRDHVRLPLLVETADALDGDVVGLGGARCEDDLTRPRADQRGDLGASGLHRLVRLPPVHVRARVGVPVLADHVRHHHVEHPRVDRRRGLAVEVGGPAGGGFALDRKASPRAIERRRRDGPVALGLGDARRGREEAARGAGAAGGDDADGPHPVTGVATWRPRA